MTTMIPLTEKRPQFRLIRVDDARFMFRPNFSVGGSTSIQDMFDDGYKAVFIGTGAWKPKHLRIPGETFGNVHYAINYLNNPDVYDLGDKVAIIGAGNSAMDVARTAIRHGSKEVTIYLRRDKAAASQDEIEYTLLDGAKFEYKKAPIEIKDEGLIMCDTEIDEQGNVTVLKDTARLVEADTIIISVSQIPQDKLVNRDKDLTLTEKGNLQTDDRGETTMKGVFASGDVVTGANTVVHAVRYSKQIADDMDKYVMSLED